MALKTETVTLQITYDDNRDVRIPSPAHWPWRRLCQLSGEENVVVIETPQVLLLMNDGGITTIAATIPLKLTVQHYASDFDRESLIFSTSDPAVGRIYRYTTEQLEDLIHSDDDVENDEEAVDPHWHCHQCGASDYGVPPETCPKCSSVDVGDIAEEDADNVPFYCQNCAHVGVRDDFKPTNGNPAPFICPKCGSTNCFPRTEVTYVEVPPAKIGENGRKEANDEDAYISLRCISVEYDLEYTGGNYAGAGTQIWLSCDAIDVARRDWRTAQGFQDAVRVVFTASTGIAAEHIIHFSNEETLIDVEECDECHELIPRDEPNTINSYHAKSCSAYSGNTV